MGDQKVSLFDAIGLARTESLELEKRAERRPKAKIVPLTRTYLVPQAKHRFEAAEIVAAWRRILGITLDSETTAKHLVVLEAWQRKSA